MPRPGEQILKLSYDDQAARDKVESAIEAIVMKYTNGRGELLASESQIAYSIAEALPELAALAQQGDRSISLDQTAVVAHYKRRAEIAEGKLGGRDKSRPPALDQQAQPCIDCGSAGPMCAGLTVCVKCFDAAQQAQPTCGHGRVAPHYGWDDTPETVTSFCPGPQGP